MLHVRRQLRKLESVAGGSSRELLHAAADCLALLLAAGATPVGAPDPSGTLVAAANALQPDDWAAVAAAASQPPRWSTATRHLFPRPFRQAAWQVLLVVHRGFSLPTCDDSGGGSGSGSAGRQAPPPDVPPVQPQLYSQHLGCTRVYLDGGMVQCILKHLAPCRQL